VYGMTGGQAAPTTQLGDITTSSPHGNIEPPFNLVGLSAASGATFVARWPGYDTLRLRKSLLKALGRNGFSFIECMVPCFVQHGRRNRQGGAMEMLERLREIVVYRPGCPPHEAVLDPQGGLVVCGEFLEMEGEGFVEKLQKLREHAKARDAGTPQ
jgi:2-oxoglutarate ferredoxin oxidoreductase subunit beta